MTYLSDPYLAVSDQAADAVDPVLEVTLHRVVFVPVYRHKINMTAPALVREIL